MHNKTSEWGSHLMAAGFKKKTIFGSTMTTTLSPTLKSMTTWRTTRLEIIQESRFDFQFPNCQTTIVRSLERTQESLASLTIVKQKCDPPFTAILTAMVKDKISIFPTSLKSIPENRQYPQLKLVHDKWIDDKVNQLISTTCCINATSGKNQSHNKNRSEEWSRTHFIWAHIETATDNRWRAIWKRI